MLRIKGSNYEQIIQGPVINYQESKVSLIGDAEADTRKNMYEAAVAGVIDGSDLPRIDEGYRIITFRKQKGAQVGCKNSLCIDTSWGSFRTPKA